MVTAA